MKYIETNEKWVKCYSKKTKKKWYGYDSIIDELC